MPIRFFLLFCFMAFTIFYAKVGGNGLGYLTTCWVVPKDFLGIKKLSIYLYNVTLTNLSLDKNQSQTNRLYEANEFTFKTLINMDRPFENNIEQLITEFIRLAGGKTLIEYLGYEPDFLNADYFFQNENIIIELKCLEKNIFSEIDDKEKNEVLFNTWLNKGLIAKSDIIPIFLNRKDLPFECLNDVLESTRNSFQRILKKANKQLRTTKEKIGNIDTKKFLMICNDGNYFLSHDGILQMIYNILSVRSEMDINCVIYFTVNQAAFIPNSDLDWHLWVPAYDCDEEENDMAEFVNDLGRDFNNFILQRFKIKNSEHIEIPDTKSGINKIKEMQYIPKDVIYDKKRNNLT